MVSKLKSADLSGDRITVNFGFSSEVPSISCRLKRTKFEVH